MKETFDIAVVGGGTVGTVLCMLAARVDPTVKILLVDKGGSRPPPKTFSITRGGVLVLKTAGVWEELEPHAHPMTDAEVSMAGALGTLEVNGQDLKADSLGHSIFAPDMDRVLRGQAANIPQCKRIEAEFVRSVPKDGGALLELAQQSGDQTLVNVEARTCVITACSESALRASGFKRTTHRYGQTIISCRVKGTPVSSTKAIERFAAEGIYAFVPHKSECGLVACLPDSSAEKLLQMDDSRLLERMLSAHNRPLFEGSPVIEAKASFPLSLSLSRPDHLAMTCLIGSALQTVHPIGGQGLNLALRDAYVWSELYGRLKGSPDMPREFRRLRACDRRRVVLSTHATAKFGCSGCQTARNACGLGLMGLSMFRPLREATARSIFLGNMLV